MNETVSPHLLDLEALDSPEPAGEEEAPPKKVKEGGVPPVMVEEAQSSIPKELSTSNISDRGAERANVAKGGG